MPRKKILFITGSLNQTTQMHQVASNLADYDCYYSQLFGDNPILKMAVKAGLTENSILSGVFRQQSEQYLKEHNLPNDYRAEVYGNQYDLVVICTELIVPYRFKNTKTIFVQEGMTDPFSLWSRIVNAFGLPPYLASTSLNGSLNRCDVYCVASEGYKDKFSQGKTKREKIVVTGIPNFDNAESFLHNDFKERGYVLVATTDIRECYGIDNRKKFIRRCAHIANGRRLIFKLHPNENHARAAREIKKYAPAGSLVYTNGNLNAMIANCSVLITQFSSVVYLGMALGKEVHSYFDLGELKKLLPIQNGGASAKNIADVCKKYIEFNGSKQEFWQQLATYKPAVDKSSAKKSTIAA